ncbi:MAG: hypothetical protein AAF961_13185, partial [Planctomycetota bacterium]
MRRFSADSPTGTSDPPPPPSGARKEAAKISGDDEVAHLDEPKVPSSKRLTRHLDTGNPKTAA